MEVEIEIEISGDALSPLQERTATLTYKLDHESNIISLKTIIYNDDTNEQIYSSQTNKNDSLLTLRELESRAIIWNCMQIIKSIQDCKIENINDSLLFINFQFNCVNNKSFSFLLQLDGNLNDLQINSKDSYLGAYRVEQKYSIQNKEFIIGDLKNWRLGINKILESIELLDSTFNTTEFINQNENYFNTRSILINETVIFTINIDINSFLLLFTNPSSSLAKWKPNYKYELDQLEELISNLKHLYPSSIKKDLYCDICYEKLTSTNQFKCLNGECNKIFHYSCILEWIGCNSLVKHYYNVKVFNCLNCNQLCTINIHN